MTRTGRCWTSWGSRRVHRSRTRDRRTARRRPRARYDGGDCGQAVDVGATLRVGPDATAGGRPGVWIVDPAGSVGGRDVGTIVPRGIHHGSFDGGRGVGRIVFAG